VRMAARTTTTGLYLKPAEFKSKSIVVIPHVGAPLSKARYVIIAPHVSSRQDFGAHDNNLPNLLRALNERVYNVQSADGLIPTPQPLPGIWKTMSAPANRLASQVRKFGIVEPLTTEEFVEQCPSNKRKLYADAAAVYNTRGWSKRDCRIKAFVKFEKLNFTKKSDPAPRIIQPRTPVYNIALGRYTRRIEELIYSALACEWSDDPGAKVVMKGLTVEEVADHVYDKWHRFHSPCAVGLDASRFDQHVSYDALKWEHGIYKKIFDYSPELMALLKCQLANEGYAFIDGHKLTYKTKGTRASGDMNTSLGNCIIMCTLVREYVRSLGIVAEFINNGDDCVLFIEKDDFHKLSNLPAWFLEFGFEMEVEAPVYELEHVVFCQSQPVLYNPATNKYVMVRQPQAALGKDAMCLSAKTERDYRQWSYQVGVGGLALYGDMPIYKQLYMAYKRNGVMSNVHRSLLVSDSGFMRMTRQIVRGSESSVVSDETRVSFYKAFGIIPSIQVDIEQRLSNHVYDGVRDYSHNIAVVVGLFTA